MNHFFVFSKTMFAAFIVLLFLGTDLYASVKVSRGKILYGNSFRTIANSWGVFECQIENPDPRPRKVMIRLRGADGYSAVMNSNSLETEVPAGTSLMFRAPVFLDNSEKYAFEVFEDGIRRPNSFDYTCSVKLLSGRQELVGILGDNENTLGGFTEHPQFSQTLFPVAFRANNVPLNRNVFQSLRVLIVCSPDFRSYTSEQFSAILEYVANGGTLVFADPEGTLAAAGTPLNVLLPVQPLRVRKISSLEGVEALFPGLRINGLRGREILFADSTDAGKPGVTFARHEGFPLYREMSYGLGTVRFLAFSPDRSNFPDDRVLSERLLSRICMGNGASPVFSAFSASLDKLTGFSVPRVSTVRNLILAYLAVLVLVILAGIRLKRPGTAWFAATLVALATTCLILYYVRISIGGRGSLAAMVRIENRMSPGSSESFVSLYASNALKTSVLSVNPRDIFSAIPRNNLNSFNQAVSPKGGDFNVTSPLDLRVLPTGSMSIHEMNIASRSSRQFMKSDSPDVLSAALPAGDVQPRLAVRQNGVELLPWTAPDGLEIESAFILFPGASRLLDVTSSGRCTLASSGGVMTDPLLESIREAMEKSYPKNNPALVLVSAPGKSGLVLEKTFAMQGKKLTLIPVRVVCSEQKISLPNEMLVMVPADATSRLILDGNRLKKNFTMQPDFGVSLAFSLPSAFVGFRPQSAVLKLVTTNTENVRVVPKIKLPGGATLVGKSLGGNEYLFSGDRIADLVDPLTNTVTLVLDSAQSKPQNKTSQDFSLQLWSVLEMELSLKGTLPGNAEWSAN